ncbi:hypothetical protein Tdes44962_MAKER00711 [Teratosphaeria destructans]|uniref:Uncharacterized protein n=1 Tax=Teratosphaeria destructans TaxID=418781 RepID=A0A9W7SM23_9PEZI|nr:hypothetical protein Tdes44962_MAKER00711 [Teratosphaeria destructans]
MAPVTRNQPRLQRLGASGEGHASTAARSSGIQKARSGSKKKAQGRGTKAQASWDSSRDTPQSLSAEPWSISQPRPLGKDSLLNDEAVLGIIPPVRSVPDAYNALWLEQRHFRRIVRDHEGWVSRVSEPMDKRGRPAHKLMHDYYVREMPSVGSQSESGTSSTPDKQSQSSGLREEVKAEELASDNGDEMEDWEIEEMADRLSPSLEKY